MMILLLTHFVWFSVSGGKTREADKSSFVCLMDVKMMIKRGMMKDVTVAEMADESSEMMDIYFGFGLQTLRELSWG